MLKHEYNRTYNVKLKAEQSITFNQFIAELEEEFSILHGHQLIILDSKELTTEENEFAEYEVISRIKMTCIHLNGKIRYPMYYICQSLT